jgi:hypothetical protein
VSGRTVSGRTVSDYTVSGRIVFRCDLGTPRPALPDWVTAPGEA